MVAHMKNNKVILLFGAAVVLSSMALICQMSVASALKQGGGGIQFFSFGGRAELRNTIEIEGDKADRVNLIYGGKNIKIYPSKDDTVVVKEYLYSSRPEAKASVTYGDGEVLIEGANTRTFVVFGFFWGGGERIEVYVPEKRLEEFWVETGSGNITCQPGSLEVVKSIRAKAGSGNIKWGESTAEEISLQAGSGNISAEKLKGNISLQTRSGNINGNKLEGVLNVQSGSGNILLKEVIGSGEMKSRSGNVKAEAPEVTGDIAICTNSGNSSLEIPADLSFHFRADTGSGNIYTDFENQLSFNKKGNHGEGDVGEGKGPTITMEAGSGNVRIEQK